MSALTQELRQGDRVFVGASSNEPVGLLDALRTESLPSDLRFIQFPIGAYNRTDFTQWSGNAHLTTFFMTPSLKAADRSRLHFLPMQMRYINDYVGQQTDVALLQLARDRSGVLRLGPNVDFAAAALTSARVVLAEINTGFVAPSTALAVEESRISASVETARPLQEVAAAPIDDVARRIGGYVASLIDDGDCLQTGIGAIPAAILEALGQHNDLGLHGGLIDDGGRALIEAGVVTGAAKTRDRHRHVTGMALGSTGLYDWIAERDDVLFKGADYTHEVSVIRELTNFVSINSAVEVDLHGQINAEVAGGRQISGTGGSVDFMRAAKASPGGRSIVALQATARGGSVSRIVPRVELVTALRTDTDIVVTEYGIAHLKDLPLAERADALIAIAAPDFRDQLRERAHANTLI